MEHGPEAGGTEPGRDDRARAEPGSGEPGGAGPGRGGPGGDGAGALRWRVSPALPGLKLAGALLFVLLGFLFGADTVRLTLAGIVAVALAAWAARDLIAPVRLAADRDGVTVVVGYAGHRHLPWSTVERIRVDTRPRLGLRTETLEIDAGETLHLFSSYDLSAPPADVAERLNALRPS